VEETVEDKAPDFSEALDLKEEDSSPDIVSDLIDNSQEEELKTKIFEISTEDEFAEKLKMVKKEDKILILDFFGTWCAPCKIIEKVLIKIAIDFSDKLIVCKINVDNSSSLTSSFKVRGVPTLLFFDGDGVEINRLVGARDYEEIAFIINNNQK
jgi:thioredoxin 1